MPIFPREPQSTSSASTSSFVTAQSSTALQRYTANTNNNPPPPFDGIQDTPPPAGVALSPPPINLSNPTLLLLQNPAYFHFVSDLPFQLRFSTVSYPFWAQDLASPLPYHPIPLAPMPGMPSVPQQEVYEFTHLVTDSLVQVMVDELLIKYRYGELCHLDVVCVYLGFTDRRGQRARIRVKIESVYLVAAAWAKEVMMDRLDAFPEHCECDGCGSGDHGSGNGFEVEVVFRQGVDQARTRNWPVEQAFGGKKKLPFHCRKASIGLPCGKKVRFR